jgi:carboxynorspermidine decarboxylase
MKPFAQHFDFDLSKIETPSHILDLGALNRNLAILKEVQDQAGCKIILAQKGFSQWSVYKHIAAVLAGTTASSLNEARLGREEFGKEVHFYSPAVSDQEFEQLLQITDHFVLNSVAQKKRLLPRYEEFHRRTGRTVEFGLRLNHQHREVEVDIYDPSSPCSRFGVLRSDLSKEDLEGISGLHFHSLCQHGADALQRTLVAVEKQFGDLIPGLKWINMGGGHYITHPDYNLDLLVSLIRDFKTRYGVEVYLEPGGAVALNAGVLVASVLEIVHNQVDIAVLDVSASAHMPDVLEMPYRPDVIGAEKPRVKPHTYRLAGNTCLAGDVIGDYSFDHKLSRGDKLVFTDMAQYSMVKNTNFNGVQLPSIGIADPSTGKVTIVRTFSYEDYKGRLS